MACRPASWGPISAARSGTAAVDRAIDSPLVVTAVDPRENQVHCRLLGARGDQGGMLLCNPPPQKPPWTQMKPFICILYAIMFSCDIYVIRAFLPSVPGRARNAHPLINTPPGWNMQGTCCVAVLSEGPNSNKQICAPLSSTSRLFVVRIHSHAQLFCGCLARWASV